MAVSADATHCGDTYGDCASVDGEGDASVSGFWKSACPSPRVSVFMCLLRLSPTDLLGLASVLLDITPIMGDAAIAHLIAFIISPNLSAHHL